MCGSIKVVPDSSVRAAFFDGMGAPKPRSLLSSSWGEDASSPFKGSEGSGMPAPWVLAPLPRVWLCAWETS